MNNKPEEKTLKFRIPREKRKFYNQCKLDKEYRQLIRIINFLQKKGQAGEI